MGKQRFNKWLRNPKEMEVFTVKDVGPYGLWTTIVVRPDHTFDRPLRGFHYSIGGDIPGLVKVPACRSDTNLNVAGCLVDEKQVVESITWAVPAIALGKFQVNGKDYTVKRSDIVELIGKARLSLHTNKGDIEIPLVAVEADAVGNYGGTFALGPHTFELGRLEAFWAELSFAGPLKIKGALPLIITLNGERARGVM